jgi:predicted outer membrane repeat protein
VCGAKNTCQACAAHGDCPSSACLGDGSCAAEADVAYVDQTGTATTGCTRAAPCGSITAALAAGRPYVKVHGTINDTVAMTAGSVTIVADPGATLMHDTASAALTVSGNGTLLSVYGLKIVSPLSTGVSVPTAGQTPTLQLIGAEVSGNLVGANVQAGTFKLVRSKIIGNREGGVVIEGTAKFYIVGNTFFANGALDSAIGALGIKTKLFSDNRLDFNSFLNNQTTDTGGAIQCDAGMGFTARNNIIYNPSVVGDPITGTCAHDYSLVPQTMARLGANIITGNPMFVNLMTGDMHLLAGSPASSAAAPNADVSGLAAMDMAGTQRPAQPPPRASIGAYQMPMQ